MSTGTVFTRVAPWTMLLALFGLTITWAPSAYAQDDGPQAVTTSASDVSLRMTGTFHPRFSYGFEEGGDVTRLGFGLRRARLRTTATFLSSFGVHYDVDLSSGALSSVDLYAFYRPTDRIRLRFGYLAGAQPRAYIFTSHTRIDAIERAAIAERWSRATIGSSGRDFGFEMRYQATNTRFDLYVHNGDGNFSRARGNFRQSVSRFSATGGSDQTALAISGYVNHEVASVDGLEIGGFAGFNGSRNDNTQAGDEGRQYVSYSGHVYWGANPGSQPVRLKADVLGVVYEDVAATPEAQHLFGYALFGAVEVRPATEAFARFEQLRVFIDEDAESFVTVGLTFSPSALRDLPFRQERFTLAYANALAPEVASGVLDQHLIVLQAQFVF